MPDVKFWQQRFEELGKHSVGPGDTKSEAELENHRQHFLAAIKPWLENLNGPVLDFGCGVGRWVNDLPRPYLGLDLTPEHLDICKQKYQDEKEVRFDLSETLHQIPTGSMNSAFTCTVLQHIVEQNLRREIIQQFARVLSDDGMLLSIEWAPKQREYDWCTAVTNRDFARHFEISVAGEVIEEGRKSLVWRGKKKHGFFAKLIRVGLKD